MEIGSFRELDLRTGFEYYTGKNVASLNSGRAGIYHALLCMNCNKIKIPYYQCETVKDFLIKKGISISYYNIDENFKPIKLKKSKKNEALLIVNYFGFFSSSVLSQYINEYSNVIIDNTQAFYQEALPDSYSIYSPRKFFGVPDGAYVIGENSQNYIGNYKRDESASTSSFLLTRIETGSNENYAMYKKNEERIEHSDILQMSKLTHALLDNIDYNACKLKRKNNFEYACKKFDEINQIKTKLFSNSGEIIPMVYPLLIENENLRFRLKENKIFVGQWWKYLENCSKYGLVESYVSKYLIPIPIDHRYASIHLDYIYNIIFENIKEN